MTNHFNKESILVLHIKLIDHFYIVYRVHFEDTVDRRLTSYHTMSGYKVLNMNKLYSLSVLIWTAQIMDDF